MWKPRPSSPAEGQRAHLTGALPHLVFLRPPLHPGRMQVDDEDRHSPVPGLAVRAGEDEAVIGHRGVVDPDLATVEPPAVAVPDGLGPDARDIRSRLGFGDAIGNRLSCRHDIRKDRCPLGPGSVPDQQRRDQFDQSALIRDRRIPARQLLHDQRIAQRVEAGAAHVFGHADPEQPEFAHLLVDFRRKAFVAVEVGGDRADGAICEIPGHVANLEMGFGEIHPRFR